MTASGATRQFLALAKAIAAGNIASARRMLAADPQLATMQVEVGATRRDAKDCFLDDIGCYVYTGDTALHIAAAGYQESLLQELLKMDADIRAKNRLGAEPLHYAAVGRPGSRAWNPRAQAAAITALIGAGADPNAIDKSGVTPLHRAVRTRSAAAVEALLALGADLARKNNNGSTAMRLAQVNSGRSGSGSPEAKAERLKIVRLLEQHGAR
jgi:hypothetical protein